MANAGSQSSLSLTPRLCARLADSQCVSLHVATEAPIRPDRRQHHRHQSADCSALADCGSASSVMLRRRCLRCTCGRAQSCGHTRAWRTLCFFERVVRRVAALPGLRHQIVCRDQLQLGLPQVLLRAAAALKTRRLLVLRCACARVRWPLAVGRGSSATTRHWPSIAALPAPSVLVANSAKIIARHPSCAGHGRAAGCGLSQARRRWRLPLQVAFLDVDPRAGCATLEHQGHSRRALPRRMVLQLCEWLFGAADAREAPYPRGRGGTVQATLTPPRPPPQNQTHRTCPFP